MHSINKLNLFQLSATILLTLTAFAANSVLCRLALKEGNIVDQTDLSAIDPSSFTGIRIISGALFLAFIVFLQSKRSSYTPVQFKPKWRASIFLFIYAAAFSFGYISQDTGVGALILFGCVQISMITVSFLSGRRLQALEWIGIILAFSGLIYLIYPELNSPSFMGAILMAASGIAWALYSVAGMGSKNPINDTATNFIRASIYAVLLIGLSFVFSLFTSSLEITITTKGLLLAMGSGMLASGAGYTLWYSVLKYINVTQAAVLQLSVPVIAAIGGVIFASEPFTLRFLIASLAILGGILLVLLTTTKN